MSESLKLYNKFICQILDLESDWSYDHKLQIILERFLNANEKNDLESYNKYLCKSLNLESEWSYDEKLNLLLEKFSDSNP